jgi:hypothetical protein
MRLRTRRCTSVGHLRGSPNPGAACASWVSPGRDEWLRLTCATPRAADRPRWMTWWDCDGGGVLEFDGLDVELELRLTENGRAIAWWVASQTGEMIRVACVGTT